MFCRSNANTLSPYSRKGVGRREAASSVSSTADSINNDVSLEQVISVRWSHQPPKYKTFNSMEDALPFNKYCGRSS